MSERGNGKVPTSLMEGVEKAYPPCLITVTDLEDAPEDGVKQFTRFTDAAAEPQVHFLKDISGGTIENQGTFCGPGTGKTKVFKGKELNGITGFVEYMRSLAPEDILFFVHGFSNLPESPIVDVYQNLHSQLPESVLIVPVVWPCNDSREKIPLWAYHTDQGVAEHVAPALAKVFCDLFENFIPDVTRVHLMCHSMGNRVLRMTARYLNEVVSKDAPTPLMVENIFMIAADVPGNLFHSCGNPVQNRSDGQAISEMGKNIIILHAGDDDPLIASYIANLFQPRLGRTGPKPTGKSGMFGCGPVPEVPKNVISYDCTDWCRFLADMSGHGYVYQPETVAILMEWLLKT